MGHNEKNFHIKNWKITIGSEMSHFCNFIALRDESGTFAHAELNKFDVVARKSNKIIYPPPLVVKNAIDCSAAARAIIDMQSYTIFTLPRGRGG